MSKRFLLVAAAVAASFAVPAQAQEIGGAEIDRLVRGNTAIFDVYDNPATGAGATPYYFGADGRAVIRLPNGRVMTGPWRIEGNAYCTDWDVGPRNSCSKLVRSADGKIEAVNPADGKPRSRLREIKPGNSERL